MYSKFEFLQWVCPYCFYKIPLKRTSPSSINGSPVLTGCGASIGSRPSAIYTSPFLSYSAITARGVESPVQEVVVNPQMTPRCPPIGQGFVCSPRPKPRRRNNQAQKNRKPVPTPKVPLISGNLKPLEAKLEAYFDQLKRDLNSSIISPEKGYNRSWDRQRNLVVYGIEEPEVPDSQQRRDAILTVL